jgi:hypothetical protein
VKHWQRPLAIAILLGLGLGMWFVAGRPGRRPNPA